jgi:ABC-type uncharacterized transport system ATPase subunit
VSGTANPKEESARSLAELMIGRELPVCVHQPREPGEVLLSIDRLSVKSEDPFGTSLKDISLALRSGEIVGIAGISGNGQQELLKAISGERVLKRGAAGAAGSIHLAGVDVGSLDAAQRRRLRLGFVPEERLGRGAAPELSLADNALLTGYVPAADTGMVKHGLISAARCASLRARSSTVSMSNAAVRSPRRRASRAAICKSSSSAARSRWRRR